MLDKTPQWLEWAAYQAAMCDVDMAKKVGSALAALFGGGQTEAQDTDKTLADMGIGKRHG